MIKKIGTFILSTFLVFACFGCASNKSEQVKEIVKETLTDGTYYASAKGFSLEKDVSIALVVRDGKISSVEVTDNAETPAKFNAALALCDRIVDEQSVGIDNVAGATASSMAIKMAAMDAIIKAGGGAGYEEHVAVTKGEDQTLDCDVVVVGLGGSGTAAALSAAQNGAKVIGIEKAAMPGGTSVVTSGPLAINPLSQVKANGGDLVDKDALLADWLAYTTVNGKQDAKEEIVRLFLDESGNTLEWLMANGFQFDEAKGFLGGKWKVFTPYTGNKALTQGFFDGAIESFKKLGGQTFFSTTVTDLIVDNGVVKGVKAKTQDGAIITVNAKNVILATGGFGGSDGLMEEYLGESWKLYGSYTNTGDGIALAKQANGATYNANMPPMSHFSAPVTIVNSLESAFDNDILYGMVATRETIALTKAGKRFVNEEQIGTGAYVGGARFYRIYSSSQIETLRNEGFAFTATGRYLIHAGGNIAENTPIANIDAAIEVGLKNGDVYKANTLEDLVKTLNSNGANMQYSDFKASIDAYNEAANGGNDVMNKSAESFARLGAIKDGEEYYVAVVGAPYIYSTCGGLDINDHMQVLDGNGNVITGLYAVGTDSMGVLFTDKKGYANYGGVAQGWAYTSGKLAGEYAAK